HPIGTGRVEREEHNVRAGLCEDRWARRGSRPGERKRDEAQDREPSEGQNNTLTAHCIARGPPCAITGLPASTSGVDWIGPNRPLRTFDEVFAGKPRLTRFSRLKISHRAWMRALPLR